MKKPLLIRSKKRNKLKQYFFRLKYLNTSTYRWLLKLILKTTYIELKYRVLSIFLLINLINRSSISKHKNVCLLSSWFRGVNTFTKLNRLTLREKSARLLLPGIMNDCW